LHEILNIVVISLVWALWGVAHSVLASNRFKDRAAERFGLQGVAFRRLYNALALVTVVPVAALTWFLGRGSPAIVELSGPLRVLPVLAVALALLVFVDTLRVYNGREFAGFIAEKTPTLAFSTTHRFVRHPWYFAILLIIWVRSLSVVDLAVNVVLTGYLVVGASLEERRLAERHALWRNYATRVPMLLPWPRRYLTTDGLAALISSRD